MNSPIFRVIRATLGVRPHPLADGRPRANETTTTPSDLRCYSTISCSTTENYLNIFLSQLQLQPDDKETRARQSDQRQIEPFPCITGPSFSSSGFRAAADSESRIIPLRTHPAQLAPLWQAFHQRHLLFASQDPVKLHRTATRNCVLPSKTSPHRLRVHLRLLSLPNGRRCPLTENPPPRHNPPHLCAFHCRPSTKCQ